MLAEAARPALWGLYEADVLPSLFADFLKGQDQQNGEGAGRSVAGGRTGEVAMYWAMTRWELGLGAGSAWPDLWARKRPGVLSNMVGLGVGAGESMVVWGLGSGGRGGLQPGRHSF